MAPRFSENPQVRAKTAEPNKEDVQTPVVTGGTRSRAVTVSSITTKNTLPSRLKRKLVIDNGAEAKNSPPFKKKYAANSSSLPTRDKNTGPRSPIPNQNIL